MLRVVGAFLFVLVALAGFYVLSVSQPTSGPASIGARSPHLYGSPETSIKEISLVVIYLVPANKKPFLGWEAYVKSRIADLEQFHESQFLGLSHLTTTYISSPVFGSKESTAYEIDAAHHTDATALEPVQEELARLNAAAAVPAAPPGAYRAYLVILEGAGAAGSGDMAVISRSYLTDPINGSFASTMLAHEFYHTLGIPDGYDTSSHVYQDNQKDVVAVLTSDDIMGRVRVPLVYAYLDQGTKTAMGL